MRCFHDDSMVKDSRETIYEGQRTVRRRRVCKACNEKFTTYELTQFQMTQLQMGLLRGDFATEFSRRMHDAFDGIVSTMAQLEYDAQQYNKKPVRDIK